MTLDDDLEDFLGDEDELEIEHGGWEGVPAELYLDPEITDGELRQWIHIAHCGGVESRAVLRRKKFAAMAGKGTSTIDARIKGLTEKGWLLVTPRFRRDQPGTTTNRYTLLRTPIRGENDPRLLRHQRRVAAYQAEMARRQEANRARREPVTSDDDDGGAGVTPSQDLGSPPSQDSGRGPLPENREGPSQDPGSPPSQDPGTQRTKPLVDPNLLGSTTTSPQDGEPAAALHLHHGADALVVVVLDAIPRHLAQAVGKPTLHRVCQRLVPLGWTPELLGDVARRRDWHGIRAGGVIAWIRELGAPAPAEQRRPAPPARTMCPDHPEHPQVSCPEHPREAPPWASDDPTAARAARRALMSGRREGAA